MNAAAHRDVFPIERLENFDTGEVRYVPLGQTFFDDEKTLERDGLMHFEYDGKCSRIFTLAPEHPRVLCWQLSQNFAARRRGEADVFPGLQVDVYTEISEVAH